MNKISMGSDFTDEEGSTASEGEKEVKKPEESGDENENSADSSDSENNENVGESIAEEGDESKDVPEDDKKSEEPKEETPDKQKVLQGLLDTEKDLEKSHNDIDEAIAAAKARIIQKRHERREKREVVDTIDSKFPDEEGEDLSDIDSETLKVLDKYTRAKGLVPKSELSKMNYQTQHDAAQDAFYALHPEYLPENDSDDTLYNALKKELSVFTQPKDPKLIPKLFEKAHTLVKLTYPDKFVKKVENKVDNINKSVRLKTAGLGGKPSGGSNNSDKSGERGEGKVWSDVQINALRNGGWTEEEIKDLLNK